MYSLKLVQSMDIIDLVKITHRPHTLCARSMYAIFNEADISRD